MGREAFPNRDRPAHAGLTAPLTRLGRVRATVLSLLAVTAGCLLLSDAVRGALWGAVVVAAYALGITRPQLLLLPAVLIIGWIAIDALAVFAAFWMYDRRELKRARLRQRLLEEEGLLRQTRPHPRGSTADTKD